MLSRVCQGHHHICISFRATRWYKREETFFPVRDPNRSEKPLTANVSQTRFHESCLPEGARLATEARSVVLDGQSGLLKPLLLARNDGLGLWLTISTGPTSTRFLSARNKSLGGQPTRGTPEFGLARGRRALPGSSLSGFYTTLWKTRRPASWPCILEAATLHLLSLDCGPVSALFPFSGHSHIVTKCQRLVGC